ncbi:MAG: NlpC/P60 family protein [Emergencia sp.]|nr:NlpC/P60 family protein [Emergencia sp.]
MSLKESIKSKKYMIAGIVILAIAVLAVLGASTIKANASEDYWDVKIGENTVAVLTSESAAKQVIRQVKNHYIQEGAVVKAITCTPEMTVEMKAYKVSEKPTVVDVDEAVDYILFGTKEKLTYTVKSGDSLWSIAQSYDFTVEEVMEMNRDHDFSMLYPGDELRLYEMKPMVDVLVTQEVTSEKKIKFKTVKETSSEVLKNTTVVKQEGAYGKRKVTELVTSKNGVVTESEELNSEVIKKPKKRIVVKGTGTLPAPTGGKTYQGSGSAVANYALRFVGTPYVYGGSSLTEGADCSGFVLAVYKHFGITMAHDAGVMRSYGKEVPLSAAMPGDLVCYYGHVAIYIGGGQVVHAVNEGMGVAVTGVGYTGSVICVRRIIE